MSASASSLGCFTFNELKGNLIESNLYLNQAHDNVNSAIMAENSVSNISTRTVSELHASLIEMEFIIEVLWLHRSEQFTDENEMMPDLLCVVVAVISQLA